MVRTIEQLNCGLKCVNQTALVRFQTAGWTGLGWTVPIPTGFTLIFSKLHENLTRVNFKKTNYFGCITVLCTVQQKLKFIFRKCRRKNFFWKTIKTFTIRLENLHFQFALMLSEQWHCILQISRKSFSYLFLDKRNF